MTLGFLLEFFYSCHIMFKNALVDLKTNVSEKIIKVKFLED